MNYNIKTINEIVESANIIGDALKKPYERLVTSYFNELANSWSKLNDKEKTDIVKTVSETGVIELSRFINFLEI